MADAFDDGAKGTTAELLRVSSWQRRQQLRTPPWRLRKPHMTHLPATDA
jgi:hypothetical protein